jgi:hypothetical protein
VSLLAPPRDGIFLSTLPSFLSRVERDDTAMRPIAEPIPDEKAHATSVEATAHASSMEISDSVTPTSAPVIRAQAAAVSARASVPAATSHTAPTRDAQSSSATNVLQHAAAASPAASSSQARAQGETEPCHRERAAFSS